MTLFSWYCNCLRLTKKIIEIITFNFLYCIPTTIVSDSSELNIVKQGREEWTSKCSKISDGGKRSRQNFFFHKYKLSWCLLETHTFMRLILVCFSRYSVDYWKPFPAGLGCLRESVLFVCSVFKELSATFTNSGNLKVKRVYWISVCNDGTEESAIKRGKKGQNINTITLREAIHSEKCSFF